MKYMTTDTIKKPDLLPQQHYEVQEKYQRNEFLKEINGTKPSHEVEWIDSIGAFWGDLTILETLETHIPKGANIYQMNEVEPSSKFYLYYKSKNKLLDQDAPVSNSTKYHFRSFKETQKVTDTELLIDLDNVNEIFPKHFLLNPVAIEIYDRESNKMYFFNFMNIEAREIFLTALDSARCRHKIVYD